MGLVDLFDKLIVEHGSSSVLRDHLALLREQTQIIENKVTQLEQANTELEKQVEILRRELESEREAKQFVEHRGALFKREPKGGYALAVYCPKCRKGTSSVVPMAPFHCGECHWMASFKGSELEKIMTELPN